MTPDTPAGWYPAAHANNELRYWDGAKWLDIAPPAPRVSAASHANLAQSPARPTAPTHAAQQPRADKAASRAPKKIPAKDLPEGIGPKPKRRWGLAVLAWIVVLLIGVAVVTEITNPTRSAGTASDNSSSGASGANDVAPDEPEFKVPYGFKNIAPGLAGKFVDRDCSITIGSCSHMEVIAIDGCPSGLYMELNVLDSAGNVLGFTNDTTGALRAEQKAILEFVSVEDGASKIELTEASCY